MLANKRILVLAPHADDEVACGGTLARAIYEGAIIRVLAFSDCAPSVPRDLDPKILRKEFAASMEVLGVKDFDVGDFDVRCFPEERQDILERMMEERGWFKPDIVLCPSTKDYHQDHKVICEEASRAFRNVHALLGWEPQVNARETVVDLFVTLDQAAMNVKLSMWQRYESQRFRGYWDDSFLQSLAKVRGKQCRAETEYAEGFEVISIRI